MSSDLLDEIASINSIYGDNTLSPINSSPNIHSLTLPSLPSVSLRLEFPPNYPATPPSILGTQSVGNDLPKGIGIQIVEFMHSLLAEIFIPGAPVIFDLIEESSVKLAHLGDTHAFSTTTTATATATTSEGEISSSQTSSPQPPQVAHDQHHSSSNSEATHLPPNTLSEQKPPFSQQQQQPPWTLSSSITSKKSTFLARAAPVTSVQQAQSYITHLLTTDKKASKATHNISAWRILGAGGVVFQDCDDDGESGAGSKLLGLLEVMGVWGVVVVVSRWFGGVLLGPERFRVICACGRDAVVRGGFVIGEGKERRK